MAVPAALLRQLHRIHQQLSDLRYRLERGPRQVQARQSNVAQLQGKFAESHEAVQQTRLAADAKQLDLKTSEGKISDWKGKLNVCNSNKEFHSLQEQIAAAEMANSVLADEILEALERIDQLQAAAAGAQGHVEAAKSDLARFRDAAIAEAEVIRRELQRLEGELAEAERELPVEFRDDYERVIRGKGDDGMSVVDRGVCEGCGQSITLNRQNQLLLSKPVFCTACGQLLYAAEP